MQRAVRWFLCILSLLVAFLMLGVPAMAQDQFGQVSEAATSASPLPEEELPTELNQRRVALRDRYFNYLEDYRDAERQYIIAQEQYYQLNTLTAQDEAIRRAREVLRLRAEVLQNYYEYLEVSLTLTLGIESSDKDAMLNKLRQAQQDFEVYKDKLSQVDDRIEVQESFVTVNSRQREWMGIGYATLSLMKLGQLQSALDNARLMHKDLGEWLAHQDMPAAEKAKRQRGLDEVMRLLDAAQQGLREQGVQYRRRTAGESVFSSAHYQSFQDDVAPSYAQMRQAVQFLKEAAGV